MNKHPDIPKKVNETLESLEGIKRAEPQSYFYTRLTGKLQRIEKTLWETMGSFLAKPAVVAICLSFVLVFNAFILLRQGGNTGPSAMPGSPTEQPQITDNEYVFASGSSFDYENLDQQ